MSLEPRAEELLAKYPDQLDEEQLAELVTRDCLVGVSPAKSPAG